MKTFSTVKISEIPLTENAKSCTSSAKINEVISILQDSSLGSVVIVDDENKVKGIFTERDFILKIAGQASEVLKEDVEKYLTPDPVCLKEEDSLALAMLKMRMGGFRHIIIVDENETLKSVVSQRDILNYMIDMTGRK